MNKTELKLGLKLNEESADDGIKEIEERCNKKLSNSTKQYIKELFGMMVSRDNINQKGTSTVEMSFTNPSTIYLSFMMYDFYNPKGDKLDTFKNALKNQHLNVFDATLSEHTDKQVMISFTLVNVCDE